MRRQKNGGFSILRRARDEKRIAPFIPPLPQLGLKTLPPPPKRGLDRFKGSRGCCVEGPHEGRERRLASALIEVR